MSRVKLLASAAFAVLALSGIASAAASATTPALLILSGKVSELKAEGKGTTSVLEGSKTKKTISGTKTTATLSGCTELGGALDTAECEGLLTFEGTKQGLVACRSEKQNGEKETKAEVILVKVVSKLADEDTSEGVLEPLLISKVLGVDGNELTINCGGVKEKVKGEEPCLLLPGLKEVTPPEELEIVCRQAAGVLKTGTCLETSALCTELKNNPLEANLNGKELEPAAEEIQLKGTANKDLLIDD